MFIIGRNLPYLQTAISSGLDSVSQGIVQTTQQQGIEALDKAINTFSSGEANAQDLFVTQTQSQVSAPADFPDPTSFLGNQEGTGEVLNFLRDSKFSAGSELNNFSKTFLNQFARIQTSVTPEQAASLNTMQNTVGRMSNLQQSLDAQFHAGRLGGPSSGILQNSLLQKATDRVSPELTFKPADPIFDNPPLAAKASNLFVRDGSDVNEVDMNDVDQFRASDPYIMSSIAAVARQNPQLIKDMIRENTDGTYTVTFPGGKQATVTADFTTDFEAPPDQKEIWPLLIEKAVRQTVGSSSVVDTLSTLTGRPATTRNCLVNGGGLSRDYSGYPFNEMKKDFDSGKAIVLERPFKEGEVGIAWNNYLVEYYNDHRSPDRPRVTMAVSKLYTDSEGKQWVELHYPGTRPDLLPTNPNNPFSPKGLLPANPIPFENLKYFFQYAHVSQAHVKGTEAVEAGTTNAIDKASEIK